MKKIKTLLVTLMCLVMTVACSLCTIACSRNDNKITIWFGGSLLGSNETEENQNDWVISQLIKEYEQQNNVDVNLVYFEDEEAMVQLIANNCRKGNNEIPDIACLYSCEILRTMSDILMPITDHLSQDEIDNITAWDTVTSDGKNYNGENDVYGFPVNGIEVTFMAYNKSIFADAGIDLAVSPIESFASLRATCESLKNHGNTPIVASDDGWNNLYVHLFAKEWIGVTSDAEVIEMGKGLRKFSSNQKLVDSLQTANDYYRNGFINLDYPTNEDAMSLFVNGDGAMYVSNNFELDTLKELMGNNLGVFAIPECENSIYEKMCFGGSNQCLSTFKKSQHSEEAIKIIKWLSSKESNLRFCQKVGCFPNRRDISLNDFMQDADAIDQLAYSLVPYAHPTPDYYMPLEVYSDFYRYSLETVIGDMSPLEFVNKMDSLVYEK